MSGTPDQKPAFPIPNSKIRRPALVSVLAVLDVGMALALLYFSLGTISTWGEILRSSNSSLVFTLFFALLGLLHLVGAFGLWKVRGWGRIIQMVLSSCWFIGLPVGVVAGPIVLAYLSEKGMKPLFSGRPMEEMSADEQIAAEALLKSGKKWFWGFSAGVTGGLLFTIIALSAMITPADRGRMKRTAFDMREIATHLEDHKTRTGVYPENGDLQKLHELIWKRPAEGRTVLDGWGRPFRYYAWRENPESAGPDRYAIGSAGKDGAWEHPRLTDYQVRETDRYDNDIVLVNGIFVQYPEGTKQSR